MAADTKTQAPRLTVRFPGEQDPPPSGHDDQAPGAGIAPPKGILYGVLIGSLLWSALVLLGVVLW